MNIRQAKTWIKNAFFGDLKENEIIENLNEMIDKVFYSFENRSCDNCKFISSCGWECEFHNINIMRDLKVDSKYFACNSYKGKI